MFRKRGVRKAQITMFVILGLVLLILFLIIYFGIIKKAGREEPEKEIVPTEFRPVQQYVESCMHQLGIEAIKKMGAHGGYIDPLDQELTPVRMRFISNMQTRYELASLTGNSEAVVPYYLYVPGKASYFNYELGSLAPTVEAMNYQLSVYMNRELPKCLGNFESLQQKGGFTIIPSGPISTESFIRDDKVEFIVTYELNVTKERTTKTITNYQNSINFPLKKYYDLAISLMATEMITQFLESFTNSLIAYHSGLDMSMLPPVVEYSSDPYILTWSNTKVRNDLNNLLISYVPALQVNGTSSYQEIIAESDNDVEANFFKSLSMNIFNTTLPNLSITFFYPPNTIASRVQPSQGDRIKPSVEVSKGNKLIPKDQFNTYKFFYDVSYPVIVEIRGNESNVEMPEYSFLFALESNLIENKGVLAWNLGMGTVDWDYSYLNATYTFPEGSFVDEEGQDIPMAPRSTAKSLFCEESTWNSGKIGISTIDANTETPLDGVSVSYGCGTYDECWVGNTELTEDWTAVWNGKTPLCQGGYLSLNKEGYGAKTIMLSTEQGQDMTLEPARLYPIKEVTATVKKIEMEKLFIRNDWVWEIGPDSIGYEQELDNENEQVVISVTQTGFEAGSAPIAYSIIFGKDGVTEETIDLVPGEYEVSATFVDNQGVFIPGNCSRMCTMSLPIIGCTNHEYFPNANIELIPAPWGGAEINTETTGNFIITPADLANANHIEFRALKLSDPKKNDPPGGCLEVLDEMDKINEYSIKYRDNIMPVLS